MATIPDNIKKFMSQYGIDSDEIWPVPGGKSYAIKHSALERVAATQGVKFDPPQVVEKDSGNGVVALVVSASMGDASTWSFGEASPKNNKNAYPWSMAEKRAKDRCILKLLNMHGAVYSEDEADAMREPASNAQEFPRETKDERRAETVSSYIEIFKSALANATTREEVVPLWREGEYAREKLNIKAGSQIYNELHALWVARGKEVSPAANIEGKAA